MGLIDKKTRIIDFVLTEKGRDLLAQNKLRIKHYAFSDELIDYSGSLVQSMKQSASMDDIVYRNYIAPEATSMGGTGLPRDLSSFLYTCPEQRNALPPFQTSVSGSLTLNRTFNNVDFNAFILDYIPQGIANYEYDLLFITERDDTLASDREAQYKAEQDLAQLAIEDPYFVRLVR